MPMQRPFIPKGATVLTAAEPVLIEDLDYSKDARANCHWDSHGIVVISGRDGMYVVRHQNGDEAVYSLAELDVVPDTMHGVRVMVCRQGEDGHRYLFLRRPLDDKYRPGKHEPPGGEIGLGETREQTAHREVWEESGLQVQIVSTFPQTLERKLRDDGQPHAGRVVVEHLLVGRAYHSTQVLLSSEHVSYVWWTKEEVRQHWSELTDSAKRFWEILLDEWGLIDSPVRVTA